MRYLPLTPDDRAQMLAVIGAPDVEALFADVPKSARLSGPEMTIPSTTSRSDWRSVTTDEPPMFIPEMSISTREQRNRR